MPAIRGRPDTLPTGLLLAGAGGFLDAYTFVGRGGVFANAQTGNIVLLGVEAGERDWLAALLHVPPILAFVLGVALAETLARPAGRRIVRRPARFVLVAEIVVLVIVGALPPQVPDQVVTATIAFTSALQVSTFRSLQGIDYSTTLTTSNLRALVAKAYRWCVDHDAQAGRQAARIAAVVAVFGVGAGVGALCTRLIGPRAVWVAGAMLVLALAAIVIETVTLSSIETTDDHSKQDDSPGRTPQLSLPTRRSGALIYIHGGGFTYGTLDEFEVPMRLIAEQAGIRTYVVEYQLAPEAKYPTQLHEIEYVVRWLFDHAADEGVDPAKIALGGDSAGGNMTCVLALKLPDTAGPRLALQVPLYPEAAFPADTPSASENRTGFTSRATASSRWSGTWSTMPTTSATRTSHR